MPSLTNNYVIVSVSSSNYDPNHRSTEPGNNDQVQWLYTTSQNQLNESVHEEWLVFKHFDEVNDTWKKIVEAIRDDKLCGCSSAKCSTLYYQPSEFGPGPLTESIIRITSSRQSVDGVGLELIQLVKQDIQFDILSESHKPTTKVLYYNHGRPSLKLMGDRCPGTSPNRRDIWHLNIVTCPGLLHSESDYGRWILTLEHKELTKLWHILKEKMVHGNLEAQKMVCPPKQNEYSRFEKPVFHFYTSKDKMRCVGIKLAHIVCQDVVYEYKQRHSHFVTLYWNEGEPDYERIRRKGITKNWRTGEDLF